MLAEDRFRQCLSIALTEGQGCTCTHRSTCRQPGREWCQSLAQNGERESYEMQAQGIGHCLYRHPGCCWVLAAVEQLAEEYLALTGVTRPPLPSQAIQLFDETRPIELRYLPMRAHYGAVWFTGTEWVIHLNSTRSNRQNRYTLFHEAFHIACRVADPAFQSVNMKRRPFVEFLADHFSACLLMPKDCLLEQWKALPDPQALASVFQVPLPIAKTRLRQLRLLSEGGTLRHIAPGT